MITTQEYQHRRQQLAMQLPPDSIALIPAAGEVLRNADTHYRFRQDSDFYYLTGFQEPDALLLITSGKNSESILFNHAKDPEVELWTGKRLGQSNAVTALGISQAFSLQETDSILAESLAAKEAIYYPVGRYPQWERRIFDAWLQVKAQVRRGVKAPQAVYDLAPILGELRLFKSPAELALMRKAASISVAGHTRAMQRSRQLQYEYELEAEIVYALTQQGCRAVAYDSIVAAGNNACILHYTSNDQPLNPRDLVLIDAGGEYQNYAADITRTFPVQGRFTGEQRAIYELVYKAQQAGIQQVKPGIPWNVIQETVVQVLTEGLVALDILNGSIDGLIEQGAYKPFYMHNSGHWLGLDVHDVGQYKIDGAWRPLSPHMVLTVEPGLYIHDQMINVHPRWHGIGVRIEDDIVVTNDGHENLTQALPRDPDEIEAVVQGG